MGAQNFFRVLGPLEVYNTDGQAAVSGAVQRPPASLPVPCPGLSNRKPIHTRRESNEETDGAGGAVIFHTGYERD